MIVARIKVYDACAFAEWANPITAGMVGAQVRIDYASEAWDGLTKTVVFSGAVVKDVTTDDTIVDIPAECMAMAGVMLKVGVFGFRAADKKIVIPTVEANIGRLLRGTDPSGDETTNPTLPVWAEILETAKRAESISGTSAQEALNAAERALSAKDAASASAGYAEQAAKSAEDSAAAASGASASADQAKDAAAQSADAAKTAVDGMQMDLSKVKQDIAAEAKRAKEAEDNRIKKFYTGNLVAVAVPDSDDGAVRNLVIGGKCEQFTTTGANLVDFRGYKGEGYGIKLEFDENGIGIVSGTQTITSGYVFTFTKNVDLSLLTIGDTYERIGATGIIITYEDRKDYNNSFKYTSGIKSVSVFIQRTAEKYIDGEIFKPMLRKVGSGVEWEPYTGGIPSPSPDYPQEIKSVENCSMTVANTDGTETQTAAIPFTLRGIGDVRDELYVFADGTGKLVQRIGLEIFDDTSNWIREILPTGINFYCHRKTLSSNLIGPLKYLINVGRSSSSLRKKGDSFITQSLNLFWGDDVSLDYFKDYVKSNKITVIGPLENPIETALTAEQVKALFDLRTYYGGTNITYESDNGVEPVVNFDYACALENFVEYIKAAQGDDRKFIYDMGERMTDAEYVAALAYVNSEYATALTELEV